MMHTEENISISINREEKKKKDQEHSSAKKLGMFICMNLSLNKTTL